MEDCSIHKCFLSLFSFPSPLGLRERLLCFPRRLADWYALRDQLIQEAGGFLPPGVKDLGQLVEMGQEIGLCELFVAGCVVNQRPERLRFGNLQRGRSDTRVGPVPGDVILVYSGQKFASITKELFAFVYLDFPSLPVKNVNYLRFDFGPFWNIVVRKNQ